MALPRRMWAGGRLSFDAPLRVGDEVERVSIIEQVAQKVGRSGPLAFVTVRHELTRVGDRAPALVEWHDIVYRDLAAADAVTAPPASSSARHAGWRRELIADEVLLFRFSALTFDGHRIHCDRRWATEAEGYPGLVVHGPLIAMLLVDLLRRERPAADWASFRYRALRPLFDGQPFSVNGRDDGDGVELWAEDDQERIVMEARAELCT